MSRTRIVIIAADAREAERWARAGGLRASDWIYIAHADQLRGRSSATAIFALLDGWRERPDSEALAEYLAFCMRSEALSRPVDFSYPGDSNLPKGI